MTQATFTYASGQGYVPQSVTQKEELSFNTITYGVRNTYPQEVRLAADSSGIARACVNVLAEFLAGNSFENGVFSEAIVNADGVTASDLLYQTALDYALFRGFAWLANFNALGEVVSIYHIPFENVRLKKENGNEAPCKVLCWDNWANQSTKIYSGRENIVEHHLFAPESAVEQMQEEGVENYKGQVLYFRDGAALYPLSSINAVYNQVLATSSLSEFEQNFIKNGFSASSIIVNEAISPNDEVYQANLNQVNALAGTRNAGGVAYLEGTLKSLDVSTKQLDKDHTALKQSLKEDIIEAFAIPPVLLARTRQGGFPNQDEIVNSFTYYNGQTRRARHTLSRVFARVFAGFAYSINPSGDYSIQEKKFA